MNYMNLSRLEGKNYIKNTPKQNSDLIMSVQQARKIAGKTYDVLSDEEVEQVIKEMTELYYIFMTGRRNEVENKKKNN